MPANFQLQSLTRTRIYGIVQNEMASPVIGGVIFVERKYRGYWYLVDNCTDAAMTSHAWGCYLSEAGEYKVNWERYGWIVVERRQTSFTLPSNPPVGDIVFVVRKLPPLTATLEPTATVAPTFTATPTVTSSPVVTPTATVDPSIPYGVISWFGSFVYNGTVLATPGPYAQGFLQIPAAMQRRIIKAARTMQGEAKRPLDEVELDPLWIAGADMELGAQVTPGFGYRGYRIMGFSQGIVVIERGE